MSAQVAYPPGLKRRIVLLGPPASGKGTQAEFIREHYGLPVTSPGARFREEKRLGTDLGIEADRMTRDGMLLADDLVIRVFESWLSAHCNEFILDGFPRSVAQADALEILLEGHGSKLDVALELDVTPQDLRDRVARRMVCLSCGLSFSLGLHVDHPTTACPRCGGTLGRRTDDDPETLLTRLGQYREITLPLLSYYERRGLLRRIDSSRAPEEVFASVRQALEHP